uniref:Uncharacterized protein n=1 Tax=Anguilla anguilla TaxID=7936 RepID=A0A0E9PZ19_ANGAN
MTRKRRRSPR